MSRYPTPSDYQEAIQVPEVAFDDPVLHDATPRTNALGLPQPITGAFAAVFPVTTATGETLAVKCFLNEVEKQRPRYEAVAEHLSNVSIDAFVPFDYQDEGIRVDGVVYPILKMEWVDGTVLNRFVAAHLDDPVMLKKLGDAWSELMLMLEEEPIAHGDLQHGNILVSTSEDRIHLRLVDYDTMYVPDLEGWRSVEVGHRNYQHPDRTDSDFGPYLDRFPALAIYTALRACTIQPELWDGYDTGENMLFRDGDFYDPEQSDLFEVLTTLDPVADLAEALRTACYVEPSDVPRLSDVKAGRLEPAEISVSRARRERGRSPTERSRFAALFLPGATLLMVAALLLFGLGVPLPAAFVFVAGSAGGLVWARYRYEQLSLVRRRHRLEQEVARFGTAIQGLERERDRLTEKRAERKDSIDTLRAERLEELQEEALYDALKHHFIGEVRDVDGIIHKHVVRLKAANIRTAYEATPEAVAGVRRISDEARAQINMWRAALVRRYENRIPEALSSAEERRLRRYVEHRLENLDEQIARTNEKIEVQRRERERIRARLEDLEPFSFWRYVRYLLRVGTLPEGTKREPSSGSPGDEVPAESPEAVPEPVRDEGKWWAGHT